MRYIPIELLKELLSDSWYRQCCLCGGQHVQLHHAFNFAGQSISEKWCLVPLCPSCHATEKRRDINEKISWIVLNRADEATLKRYSKVENLISKRARLNEKFRATFSEKLL
jgi:hypothetical protein